MFDTELVVRAPGKQTEIACDLHMANVFFPYGLIGFSHVKSYSLLPCKSYMLSYLYILQADSKYGSVSFALLPHSYCAYAVELSEVEMRNIIQFTGFKHKNMLIFLTVSKIQYDRDKKIVFVNKSAPVIIDKSRKLGMQYTFYKSNVLPTEI